MEYVDGKPTRVTAVVVSTMHAARSPRRRSGRFSNGLIEKVIPGELLTERPSITSTRPASSSSVDRRVIAASPGRKIIVDTYGGMGRHGVGAFSGKDPSKVDRSAAYMCRWVAKNIVAAGLAIRCELQTRLCDRIPGSGLVSGSTPSDQHVDEAKIEQR